MRSRCQHHLVQTFERTQQTSLLRIRVPPKWSCAQRCYATAVTAEAEGTRNLSIASEARYSDIGVQHVSSHIHKQLFPPQTDGNEPPRADEELIELSKKHLAHHDLLGKTSDQTGPIGFELPDLQGATLDEHFYRLGMDSAEEYLKLAKQYARASPPPKPRKWVRRSGWTKYYADGNTEAVDAPDADMLTFDTEVMWHETQFPAMACAASADHWYAWLSPWLLGETENDRHLIPLGDTTKPRIVVGHNVGYDRARIAEEYSLKQTRNFFIDTMSLHVAVNGMCSRQRPNWTKARKAREMQDKYSKDSEYDDLGPLIESPGSIEDEEDLWIGRSSANSLRDVAKFHCNITIDKTQREWFGELDREGIREKLDELMDYCAADVDVTHKVYKRVFPNFLETCPHPVSFAALRHLSTEILPVNKGWDSYLENAEATYQKLSSGVEERLKHLAEKALEHKDNPDIYQKDPWLCQLDWSGQEVRMTKPKKKGGEPRLAARQKKPGMPNWYKDLFQKNDSPMALTVRTRIAPLLLRLAWDGHPLVWSDKHGWTFKVQPREAEKYRQAMVNADMSEEDNAQLSHDMDHAYFKLPHSGGPEARCVSPMAKGYMQSMENGTLSSEYAYAKEALEMNTSCSYWISARDRITKQMVVYERELAGTTASQESDQGFILPQIVPMGTVTRRAVENTWLTASNAKKNRVGSELKSMVTAPPGYCFVGADVDSQELWIASLVGDASFKLHGGNALGFMTLEGTKAAGTDLHSRTAKILGISRNDAKVFNYGRIYGAGLNFAQSLLRRFNPSLSQAQAEEIGKQLYVETKGTKGSRKAIKDKTFWFGGTESLVFNALEDFASQEKPRTPVLGAGITEALMKRFLGSGKGSNNFLTSRINWAIQSSGVDYLHLLIISMDYLCRRYNIHARLALTVHDEIRYLSKTEDKYRCAMALQVANVWTRAMFSQQMGMSDLPQSCAYFSAVDIDHVLRKEVDMDCVTPSHITAIPAGESLDIVELLGKGEEAWLDPAVKAVEVPKPERFAYQARKPVMESLKSDTSNSRAYLRAQLAKDRGELQAIAKELTSTTSNGGSGGGGAGKLRTVNDSTPRAAPPTEKKPRARRPAKPKTTETRTVPAAATTPSIRRYEPSPTRSTIRTADFNLADIPFDNSYWDNYFASLPPEKKREEKRPWGGSASFVGLQRERWGGRGVYAR
ncbi:hypothetical protein LTR62_000259 [Meristemomyces frigidus]|uniref:DNA-directed DNA polymerase n=1 Tax=Meristemomyces frigidus TaxID=1508187 RepID=A0AAN7TIQ4_9PEZI|nr:hypothetical protein LTR62_000259 [Meristemomyces frigidus]